jgi:hypothetical protein
MAAKPGTIVNLSRPGAIDTGDTAMDDRILRLLRRRREIEAEQHELERELREISRELFERRNDALFAEIESKNLLSA